MTDAFWSMLVFGLLCGAAGGGTLLVARLPAMHRTGETLAFTRLVTGLLVTFTALVMGLLIATVNTSFEKAAADLRGFSAEIIQLTMALQDFGPETVPIRAAMRGYTAAAIASTWPEEAAPSGSYPKATSGEDEFDATDLGALLHKVASDILALDQAGPTHAAIRTACLARIAEIERLRWVLIGDAHETISPPFYDVLLFWLVMIFLSFGLEAPRNGLALAAVVLVAVCVAAAFFVLLELDGPLDGLVKVSSDPMRHALRHLDWSLGIPVTP